MSKKTTWDDNARIALRDFLMRYPLISFLEAAKPECSGDTLEKRAITGAEKEGAEKIIKEIKALSEDSTPDQEPTKFID